MGMPALWRKYERLAPRALVLFASLLVLVHTAIFVWQYWLPIAWWDFWNWVEDYRRYCAGQYALIDLFDQHNEHRIATTRVVLFIDALFFHMSGQVPVVLNLGLLGGAGVMLARLAPPVLPIGRYAAAAFCAACLWSLCAYENLVQPFQIQFGFLVVFVISAAMVIGGIAPAAPGQSGHDAMRRGVVAALLFACATFSMANGMLVLPGLLLALWLRRAPSAAWAGFLPGAAASVFFYLHHYKAVVPAGVAQALPFWWACRLLAFCLYYAGSAFGAWPHVSPIAGTVVLGGLLASAIRACRQRVQGLTSTPAQAALIAIGGFVAASALAAAVGRAGAGVHQALAPRYATISVLGILVGAMLLGSMLPAAMRTRRALWAATGVAVLLLTAINMPGNYALQAGALRRALELDGLALRANTDIGAPLAVMDYKSLADRAETIRFLRDHRLNMFAPRFDPPADVTARLAADPRGMAACADTARGVYEVGTDRAVATGVLADAEGRRSASWVGLRVGDQVLGVVPALFPEPALRRRGGGKRAVFGFVTAVALPPGAGPAWLVGDFGGTLPTCAAPLPVEAVHWRLQAWPLPRAPAAGQPAVAVRPVQGVTPALSAGFAPGADLAAHMPPPSLWWPFVSSGASGDAATGTAQLIVSAPPGADLVVPLAAGPSTTGQWLELRFADGTKRPFPLPALAFPERQWRAFVIPAAMLSAHGGKVTLTAHDDGTGWGQWMAIGTPAFTTAPQVTGQLY